MPIALEPKWRVIYVLARCSLLYCRSKTVVFKVCAHTLGGLAPHSYGPKLGVGPEKGRPQLPQLPSDSRLKLLVKGYNGRAGSSVNTLTRVRSLIIHERKSNQIPL